MRRLIVVVGLLLGGAGAAAAQPRDPVGPFVIDARGLMAGLPSSEGWTPVVPAGTTVPSRGFGLDLGAHAYPVQWGPARLGVGAAVTLARGTAAGATEGAPEVVTRSRTFAPQLSLNFGHRLGWSYLSAGYGLAKVSSEAAAAGPQPASTVDPGWGGTMNVGGGARWFVSEHIGVGFDARWHLLRSRQASAESAGAPGATLFHLAVGISVH